MAGSSFIKTVKGARRGISLSKKIKHSFFGAVLLLIALLMGSALLVWWQERNFSGSYLDSLWSVMFTLIGQGEFAASPRTFWGRMIVFLLSVFGVAVFGVVFAEVLQRIINSKIKTMLGEMMGINTCKFEGHVIICGWNGRGPYLVRELRATDRQVALIAKERPADLEDEEVFFIQGNPSERDTLIRGGIQRAQGAIILGDPNFGADDSHSILTALAIEDLSPDVYTVMELHNPDNERYARYARVDDILYSDSLIADITAMCTHNEGISAFIRDVLSAADDGYSFASFDVSYDYEGRTIGEMFDYCKREGAFPVAVITPPKDYAVKKVPVSEWNSEVNPPSDRKIELPMKVVCFVKDNASSKK